MWSLKVGRMMNLNDKVVVVTRATSGIGEAIALAFAGEGAAVAVDYVGPPGPAREAVEKIQDAGGKGPVVEAAVSRPEDVSAGELPRRVIINPCRRWTRYSP